MDDAQELDKKIEELERATEKYENALENLKEQARIVYEEHFTLEDNQVSGYLTVSENPRTQGYDISGSFILNGRSFNFEDEIPLNEIVESQTVDMAKDLFILKMTEGIYLSLRGSLG